MGDLKIDQKIPENIFIIAFVFVMLSFVIICIALYMWVRHPVITFKYAKDHWREIL